MVTPRHGDRGIEQTGVRSSAATILVCDDEPLLRKTLARDLSNIGYTVIEAPTAESAADAFDRQRVDLLITDVRLPGMSGWELVEKVHAVLASLPVIVMSAYGIQGHEPGLGYVFLDKPFAMARLRAEVKKALDRRQDTGKLGAH